MASKFDSIFMHINKYKWILLGLVVLMNIFMAMQLPSLQIDNSLAVWFAKDDPALKSYQEFKRQFGNDEVIITSLQFDAPMQDYEHIRKLAELSEKISDVDGVERTMSILDIPVSLQNNQPIYLRDKLESDTAAPLPFSTLERISHLKSTRRFIVDELSCLVLYTWLDTLPDIESRRKEIHDQVYSHIQNTYGGDAVINQCGPGIIYDTLNRETLNIMPSMMGLAYLIVLILVWLFTRRIRWVVNTFFAITLSNISLFGIMALMGSKPNMVTMAIPPLIIVVGVANIIHFSKGIERLKIDTLDDNSSGKLLNFVLKPLFFNALTTAGGFASLSIAKLQVTQEYGIYAALGVLLAFIHSLLFSALFSGNKTAVRKEAPWLKKFENRIVDVMVFSARHHKLIYVLATVVLISFGFGILKLDSDTNTKDFFQKDHPIQKQIDDMENQLGYFYPADFLISYKNRHWKDTAFQRRLAEFQYQIDKDTLFGVTYSVADLINDSYSLITGNTGPAYENLPQISGPLWRELTRSIQKSDYYHQLIADDGKTVRVSVTGPIESARTYIELTAYFEDTAHKVFGEGLKIEPAGNLPLYSQSIKYTMHDQLSSLGLAICIILILIGLLLRSVRLSLLAIPSNLLPIIFILGFMGYFNIRLDLATVTIAAAILGIIVDDTIHLLYSYKKLSETKVPRMELIRQLAHQKGPALVFTSIILCSGFIVIGLAGLRSIARPGWLISIAIFVALITDIFLLPALLIQGQKKDNPE